MCRKGWGTIGVRKGCGGGVARFKTVGLSASPLYSVSRSSVTTAPLFNADPFDHVPWKERWCGVVWCGVCERLGVVVWEVGVVG